GRFAPRRPPRPPGARLASATCGTTPTHSGGGIEYARSAPSSLPPVVPLFCGSSGAAQAEDSISQSRCPLVARGSAQMCYLRRETLRIAEHQRSAILLVYLAVNFCAE